MRFILLPFGENGGVNGVINRAYGSGRSASDNTVRTIFYEMR